MAIHRSQPARINTSQRSDYLRAVQEWNARLVDLQRPIRVLDSVRWPEDVQRDFFARQARELPCVRREDYRRLNIQPPLAELRSLERAIRTRLGNDDPAARILLRRCRSYQDGLRLIEARGTADFARLSRDIYGSSLSSKVERTRLLRLIDFLEAPQLQTPASERMSAPCAAVELSRRLRTYFGDVQVSVTLSDRLSSDACAGTAYLKLRRDATFTAEDLHLLEVHEGWAHLGTSFNGSRQPLLSILGKAAPGLTPTQEGLAVLTELLAGACHPHRRQRLARRLRAVLMAEEGADFLQVFHFFRDRGIEELEAYRKTARVFRGSLPAGIGPFTKDLSYGLGLLALVKRLRSLKPDDATTIPLLFCGKIDAAELPDLAGFHTTGLLARGEFIPAPFRDGQRLAAALRDLPGR